MFSVLRIDKYKQTTKSTCLSHRSCPRSAPFIDDVGDLWWFALPICLILTTSVRIHYVEQRASSRNTENNTPEWLLKTESMTMNLCIVANNNNADVMWMGMRVCVCVLAFSIRRFSKCVYDGFWLYRLVLCFNFSRSVYKTALVWLSFRTKRAKFCCVNEWAKLERPTNRDRLDVVYIFLYVSYIYLIQQASATATNQQHTRTHTHDALLSWFLVICSNISFVYWTGVVY